LARIVKPVWGVMRDFAGNRGKLQPIIGFAPVLQVFKPVRLIAGQTENAK